MDEQKTDKAKEQSKKWIIPPGLHEKVKEFIVLLCTSQSKPIMIVGETGTGKSLFMEIAKNTLHCIYGKEIKETVVVNCADYSASAVDSNLVKVELFGSDSKNCKGLNFNKEIGLFEFANNGIIFLDEIGELGPDVQSMILTFVETKKFHKFGDNKETPSNVRIIAATNHESKLSNELKSRFQLFRIPPIRNRREDVLYYISDKYNDIFRSLHIYEALPLMCYSWKKNVREIEDVFNIIERNIILNKINGINLEKIPFTTFIKSDDSVTTDFDINKLSVLCREIASFGSEKLQDILPNTNMFLNSFARGDIVTINSLYEQNNDQKYPVNREGNICILILDIVKTVFPDRDIIAIDSDVFFVMDDIINRLYLDFIKFCSTFIIDPKCEDDIIDSIKVGKTNDKLLDALKKSLSEEASLKAVYLELEGFYEKMKKFHDLSENKDRFGVNNNIWWLSEDELLEVYYKGLFELMKGNVTHMSDRAGVARNTVDAKIKKYKIKCSSERIKDA